jgi:toxin CcdB
MQFDVYVNPLASARTAFPYVAVLQHDLAETGADRVIAFLARHTAMPSAAGRVLPIVEFDGRPFVLLIPALTTLPVATLRTPAGSVSAYRDAIVQALDWLFLGV